MSWMVQKIQVMKLSWTLLTKNRWVIVEWTSFFYDVFEIKKYTKSIENIVGFYNNQKN